MIVGVEFHRYEKLTSYDSGKLPVGAGEWVVGRTPRGLQLGRAVEVRSRVQGEEGFPLLERGASPEDMRVNYRNRLRAAEALVLGRQKCQERQLPMHFLATEFTLDGDRLILYFHAEGRVDFRVLLKDLASAFHKRIELYQVNARERAKVVGGMGPCGRVCCCTSWLREFTPVSVKLAKEQGASLNPQKISGSCGRLMCCLRYEYETYLALRKELPAVGTTVRIPEGTAQVVDVHPLRRTLVVALPDKPPFEVPLGRAVEENGSVCKSCQQPKCASETPSQ